LAVSFIPSSSPPSTSSTSSTTNPSPSQPDSTPASGTQTHRPTTLAFTFLDDYRLDLSVRSLVGSRSRLQDVPKIAQIIESRLHAWFDERAVEPRFQQIALPSLWPRKRNTRGGDEEEDPAASAAVIDDTDEGTAPNLTPNEAPDPRAQTYTAASNSTAATLEARLEAEGAKLREAEVKDGERRREGALDSATAGHGIRWRGGQQEQQERSRLARNPASAEWSGQRGMPGAMPSG
jgi:maintenance of morphology protein 1